MCQWQLKGVLTNKKDSKISGEGRTYDKKLYTFKEANYITMWDSLEILAKKLDPKNLLRNVSLNSHEESKVDLERPLENVQPPKCIDVKSLCSIF